MTIYMCSKCRKCYTNTMDKCPHCGEPTPEAHREARVAVPLARARALPLKQKREQERKKWFRTFLSARESLGAENAVALREKEERKKRMQRIRDAEVL